MFLYIVQVHQLAENLTTLYTHLLTYSLKSVRFHVTFIHHLEVSPPVVS